MTQRMDQRKKSDESKDSTAVYVHYFPSGQPGVHYFGHVAIEVVANGKRTYLSHGLSGGMVYEQDDIDRGIKSEKLIYGKNWKIPLPLACLPDKKEEREKVLADTISKWKENWCGKKYDVRTSNCAHSVNNFLKNAIVQTQIPPDSHEKLTKQGKTSLLRPVEVAEFLSALDADFKKKKLHGHIRKGTSQAEDGSRLSVKKQINDLLEQLISLLQSKTFLMSTEFFTDSKNKKVYAAIMLLLDLKSQLHGKELTKEFLPLIDPLIKKIKTLDAETAEKLAPIKVMVRLAKADDEKVYQQEYKVWKDREENIKACFAEYDKLLHHLTVYGVTEGVLGIYPMMHELLEKIHAKNLAAAQTDRPIDFKLYQAVGNMMLALFNNKINLHAVAMYKFEEKEADEKRKQKDDLVQKIKSFRGKEIGNEQDVFDMMREIEKFASQIPQELKISGKRKSELEVKIMPSIPPLPITENHVAWLDFQIQNLHYWYHQDEKAENTTRAQDLVINCARLKEAVHSVPEKISGMAELLRAEWDVSAHRFKTLNVNISQETDTQTIKFLNAGNNADRYHFDRHLGYILFCAENMMDSGKTPPQLYPHLLNLEQNAKYADILLGRLLRTEIPDLKDAHLTEVAKQYQHFMTTGVISSVTAWRELMREVQWSVTPLQWKDITSAMEMILAPLLARPEKQSLLNVVKNAIEDEKNSEAWKNAGIVKAKLKLENGATLQVPREVVRLYDVVRDLENPAADAAKLTALEQQAREALLKPGCLDALRRFSNAGSDRLIIKERNQSALIFYLGILALKKDGVIPENGNALQKIRMAGLKYLSEYVAQRDLLTNLPPLPKAGL